MWQITVSTKNNKRIVRRFKTRNEARNQRKLASTLPFVSSVTEPVKG